MRSCTAKHTAVDLCESMCTPYAAYGRGAERRGRRVHASAQTAETPAGCKLLAKPPILGRSNCGLVRRGLSELGSTTSGVMAGS